MNCGVTSCSLVVCASGTQHGNTRVCDNMSRILVTVRSQVSCRSSLERSAACNQPLPSGPLTHNRSACACTIRPRRRCTLYHAGMSDDLPQNHTSNCQRSPPPRDLRRFPKPDEVFGQDRTRNCFKWTSPRSASALLGLAHRCCRQTPRERSHGRMPYGIRSGGNEMPGPLWGRAPRVSRCDTRSSSNSIR